MNSRSIGLRGIGGRITIITLAIAILAVGAVTTVSILQSTSSLDEAQTAQLRAVRDIKEAQISSYFVDRREEINVLSETVEVIEQQTFERIESLHRTKQDAVERYFRDNPQAFEARDAGSLRGPMNEIVGGLRGLGETGETYLSEYDGGTYTLRSDIPRTGGGELVYGTDVTDIAPEYLQLAHRGEEGVDLFSDSAGTLTMAVYTRLDYADANIAQVTKINLEEALTVTLRGEQQDYLSKYTDELGYYDLFLIHPEGEIFYSVAQEADYGSNIITGEFSDSSLNEAVTEALSSMDFGFGDFSPYEPSGGEPAAFIADAIVSDGEVEFVVAMQLPVDRINAIMNERTGMGETGETYLVGPDHLMRSDSYLDPEYRSVSASFASPQTGSVDTVAATAALSGETDARLIDDYTGTPVLSAYSPVDVYDTAWAIVAEINETEVNAPVRSLVWFILMGTLVVLMLAVAAAVVFSRSISKPIMTLVGGADRLAIGDIKLTGVKETEIEKINARSDELGMIGRSFTDLIEYQREKAEVAREIGQKNLDIDVSATSDQDTLGNAFVAMIEGLNDLLAQTKDSVDQVSAGASQVSQASQELSQGATEQASSLEEISSSVTEVNSQSKQNAEHAAEASTLAREAQQNAEQGNEQMDHLKEVIAKIASSSDETKKVVKVIDDIAFQINLLALNANVEAARAGKYGKGFAVVAEEVRNLAAKSADAVQETTTIVEESVRNMEAGTEASEVTGQQLDAIVGGARRVTQYLDDIAAASREQADAITQVTEGLDQIDQVTQGNTASAEESASAAEELASQAEQLRAMVADYRVRNGHAQLPSGGRNHSLPAPDESGFGARESSETGAEARQHEYASGGSPEDRSR
ncbi:MAG: methyl-accepting chemotaxis protein [Spirochaetota bacterium]